MQAEPIDPRESEWEIDQPAYRVYFWHREGTDPRTLWTSEEWRLTETDIGEVIAWADHEAHSRRVTIWVEHRNESGALGIVRPHGWEPTRQEDPPPWTG